MTSLARLLRAALRKEWTASASPTSGITAYGNTPKKKRGIKLRAGVDLRSFLAR